MSDKPKLHPNEALKENSDFLRGNLAEEFADTSTGAISADNQQLSKFHGMYLQDDLITKSMLMAHLDPGGWHEVMPGLARYRTPGSGSPATSVVSVTMSSV